jgi:alpha-methylacyl-CoA racemase
MYTDERGANAIDGGSHFYHVYETADGKFAAVGAAESKFYDELVTRMGLNPEEIGSQMDRSSWPLAKERFAEAFRTKTLDEWCKELEGTEACFTPVLKLNEAAAHPHNQYRNTFVTREGMLQPAPAPRFSRTKPSIERPPAHPGQHTDEALLAWGFRDGELADLRAALAIA